MSISGGIYNLPNGVGWLFDAWWVDLFDCICVVAVWG